jgi:integrase/recombinase XerD
MNADPLGSTTDGCRLLRAHLAAMRLAGRRATTVRARRQILSALSASAATDLARVTRPDVIDFLGRDSLSDGSRGIYLLNIRMFYQWAIDEDLLTTDPTLKLKGPRQHRGIPRPIPPDDLGAALMSARGTVRCWLLLGAYAGLRCCEMAELRGEDIDLERLTMRIIGKGGRPDLMPIHPVLADELRLWPRTGYLFPHQKDRLRHVLPGSVSAEVNNHLHRMGIAATAHATRHLFGTTAYRQSKRDLRMTQELLRHQSPLTTAVYTKVESVECNEVVSMLRYGTAQERHLDEAAS